MGWPPPPLTLHPFPVTSIEDFGAKPNDATYDNSPSIQATVDVVRFQGGGIVYIPPGRYYCRSPIEFDLSSSLTLMGCSHGGQNGSELYFLMDPVRRRFSDGPFLRFHSVQGVSIRDLGFMIETELFDPLAPVGPGPGPRNPQDLYVFFTGVLLDFDGVCADPGAESADITINECSFQQMTVGIGYGTYLGFTANFIRLGARVERVTISRAIFTGGRNGIIGDGATDVLVQECTFNQGGPHCCIRLRERCDQWTLTACGFDPSGGDMPGPIVNGLETTHYWSWDSWIRAVWCVDDRGPGSTEDTDEFGIDLPKEKACRGLVISNCEFADRNGIQKDIFRLVAQGVSITGILIAGPFHDAAISLLDGCGGVFIAGNQFYCTVPKFPPNPPQQLVGVRIAEGVEGVVILSSLHPTEKRKEDPGPGFVLHCEPVNASNIVSLGNWDDASGTNFKLD